jgi:hypothetical protein
MTAGPKVRVLERYGPVLVLLVAGTVAVGVALARGGVDPSQVGRAYLLSVGAILILALILEFRRAGPARDWSARAESSANPQLPPQLEALQDSVRASRVSLIQYQLQVVPLLREIAADRLLLLGVSLNHDPARAAEVLGPELSAALVSEPTKAGAPARRGPRARELGAILVALEAVGR